MCNIKKQSFIENENTLNEMIINISYEPIKTDYYKKMFEKITEKKKEEEIIKEKYKYFSKCTE